ncbi:MAG TPA: RHS repeat-associated core domain-containing protein [Smithellaceae bacterium]|nr:RHS repeat-associated core domain-containing protein [Smithellaceae bacterium]
MTDYAQTIKGKWQLITTYAYDDENRLVEVKIQKGHKTKEVSFTYDPLGRRISKTVGRADFEDEDEEDVEEDDKDKGKGKDDDKDKSKHGRPFQPRTTYYVYDDQNIIAEYDENNRLIASYIHGPNIDEPLSAEISRDWVYYHADGLGSITTLTSHMGNVVQRYEYDSFGNMQPTHRWIRQPFTYTAREFDPETGLYYYRARYYDAKVGRFITRDPIGFDGGDVNLYVYVKNNPVNWTDPNGLRNVWRPPTVEQIIIPNPANPDNRAPGASNPDSNRPHPKTCGWRCVSLCCDVDPCTGLCKSSGPWYVVDVNKCKCMKWVLENPRNCTPWFY